MFDNALIYRAHSHFPGADQLAQLCQKQLFRACAATEAKRVGWSTVCGDQMVHPVNSQFLVLRFSRQERLLPAAAVKEEVEIDALRKAVQITDSVFTEILLLLFLQCLIQNFIILHLI